MEIVDRTIRPLEGFSVSHVEVAGADIFGIRDYAITESENQDVSLDGKYLELRTGYLQTADLQPGKVEITIPARDSLGNNAKMILTVPHVSDWKLKTNDGGYKKGWTFAYRGLIESGVTTLDLIYDADPAKTRHRLDISLHL